MQAQSNLIQSKANTKAVHLCMLLTNPKSKDGIDLPSAGSPLSYPKFTLFRWPVIGRVALFTKQAAISHSSVCLSQYLASPDKLQTLQIMWLNSRHMCLTKTVPNSSNKIFIKSQIIDKMYILSFAICSSISGKD